MVSATKTPPATGLTVRSRDGTSIAYETTGQGPALVLVDGALCSRAMGPMRPLAKLLAPHFTVFLYDRRGRGGSGDTRPYSVGREIEDLAAVIAASAGPAFVYGTSSGAALALEAAARGLPIRKLALFEAPFIVDDSREPVPADIVEQLEELLAEGRRADVVRRFMQLVGVPGFFIALMRLMPAWSKLKAVAHTVPYDLTIVRGNQAGRPLPAERWATVRMPTLVMDGGKSPAWMRHGMRALADALPAAQLRTLAGQTHMVRPGVVAPELISFLR